MYVRSEGLAIHCHHNILIEYCYNYQERVEVIKRTKPKKEQKTRLKLFKILPKEALKDIPSNFIKPYQEWNKAYQEWNKTYQEWDEKSKDAFHKKWCGCKEWKNNQINFEGK